MIIIFSVFHLGPGLSDFCFAQSSELRRIVEFKDPAEGQKTPERTETEDVIRVETNLIMNDIQVFDKSGNPVRDLKITDFIVKEDDQRQEISVFAYGDSEDFPRSVVLIIDYSGSQLPYIKTSIEAAKLLVEKLNPRDRMAIVTDDVELLQDFTTDKTLLKEKLEALKTSTLSGNFGQSRQYSALRAVLTRIFAKEDSRPIIIFQTDGDELAVLEGARPNIAAKGKVSVEFTFDELLAVTEITRPTIYTVIPGFRFLGVAESVQIENSKMDMINAEALFASMQKKGSRPRKIKINKDYLKTRAALSNRQQSALNQITQITGGYTYHLEDPGQAESIYSSILAEMNARYLIGYYPTNQNRTSKRRKVSIELPAYSEYKIRGRESYILEEN